MALLDGFGFLTPLGFLALVTLVPVVVLYLVQPDPRRVELPTVQFLLEETDRDRSNPLLERLRRSLLLLLQLLVLVALVTSLAGPYVAVSEQETVEETILVVDASASMATETDGTTRFGRAVAAARESTTGTTSIVRAAGEPTIPLRDGSPADAETALDQLSVAETGGQLRAAISQAASIAGDDAQILVFSDFADEDGWQSAVQSARARGSRVELRQFAGGGGANVGIVDQSFSGQNLTVTVRNYGDAAADRTLQLGDQRRSLTIPAGGVTTVTMTPPPGGGEVALSPGDSFPVDDVSYVAAPEDPTIDVVLVTNDRNRYLATALSVIDAVDLTIESPPTTIESGYDVVVYSNVEQERLLEGNVETGRGVLSDGGGVAIQAQRTMPESYGDLSLVAPGGIARNPSLASPATHALTRDITFPPPSEYVTGDLRTGRSLLETQTGTPLLATARRDGGRVLYFGYIEDASTFKFNYQYPVFWKRAVHYLAGQDPLADRNLATGERLRFDNETRVETPDGPATTTAVPLDETGFYAVGDRRYGASLVSETESAVATEPLENRRESDAAPARTENRRVPRPITGLVALLGLTVGLVEVAYLRRRGDL